MSPPEFYTDKEEFQHIIHSNRQIRASNKHNYEGCKILVNTHWNLNEFEKELEGYEDKEIIKFLKYGWPLDNHNTEINEQIPRNNRVARENRGFAMVLEALVKWTSGFLKSLVHQKIYSSTKVKPCSG